MPRYTYTGDQKLVYSHYLDVSKPDAITTLVPEPGKTYEIEQTTGHTVPTKDGQVEDMPLPMPPDEHWQETGDPTWAEVEAKKAEQAPAKKKKEQADA